MTLDGSGATSTVAWVHVVPGQADMYNLTVANDHTYAVGDSQAVVHNANRCVKWGEDNPQFRDQHIIDTHGTARYQQLKAAAAAGDSDAANLLLEKSFFNVSNDEIKSLVRQAWSNRIKDGAWKLRTATGDWVIRWQGTVKSTVGNFRVQGFYNATQNLIETAYPCFPPLCFPK